MKRPISGEHAAMSRRVRRRDGSVPDEGRHQRLSEAIRGYQKPSEAIRGYQKPSEAINGRQRSYSHQRSYSWAFGRVVSASRGERAYDA